jgi:hypothetical protein
MLEPDTEISQNATRSSDDKPAYAIGLEYVAIGFTQAEMFHLAVCKQGWIAKR